MEQNQFNPGQFQQPQPQYQPQGFQTIPLPRYEVNGIWNFIANMNFKTMSLIGTGIWLLFWVLSISTIFSSIAALSISGLKTAAIYALVSDAACIFVILLVCSKIVAYLKSNIIGILILVGAGLLLLSDIINLIQVAGLDIYNVSNYSNTVPSAIGFFGKAAIAVGLMMTIFTLKHFSLRVVVILFGITYICYTLGVIIGLFAVIGFLIAIATFIVLLIKVLGSAPIMDPYALPGEPIQQ